MTKPKVAVCILSYNRLDDLKVTLPIIFSSDYTNYEVIVVDNASTDGTQNYIKEKWTDVRLIEKKSNVGVSAWNDAFKVTDAKYLLVLDDDSYVQQDLLTKAVKKIEDDPNLAVLSFRIKNPNTNFDFTDAYPTGSLSFWGCGALIRAQSAMQVGYFDEKIFLYAHELDFSMRLLNAGFTLRYDPTLVAYHFASPSNRFAKRRFYYQRSSLHYVAAKYFGFINFIKLFWAMSIITGKYGGRDNLGTSLKAILSGTIRGIFCRSPIRREVQYLYMTNFCEFITPYRRQIDLWKTSEFFESRRKFYPK